MKTSLFALAIALEPVFAAPALAQTRADEIRWQQAQRRFDNERAIYDQERARYEDSRRRYGGGYRDRGGYGGDYDSSRYGWGRGGRLGASRHYCEGPRQL